MYRVPDGVTHGDIRPIDREGQEAFPVAGDYLSADSLGFLNNVKAEKFKTSYDVVS